MSKVRKRAPGGKTAPSRSKLNKSVGGKSKLEADMMLILRHAGLEEGLEREYRFGAAACGGPGKGLRARLKAAGLSDWRFDFAWPARRVAIEVQGGLRLGGRGGHTSYEGRLRDIEKGNAACLLGWTVIEVASPHIYSGKAREWISILLKKDAKNEGQKKDSLGQKV